MAYIINGKTLFLHVPKTGGKAVLRHLEVWGNHIKPIRSPKYHNGHATEAVLDDPRYTWDFRFGFVRNPVSWWKSLRDFAVTPDSKLFDIDVKLTHPFDQIIESCREMKDATADDFVREIGIVRFPGFYTKLLHRYFGEEFEKADYIGLQEFLDDDLRFVMDIRKMKTTNRPVRLVNVSEPSSVSTLRIKTKFEIAFLEGEVVEKFYKDLKR